MEPIDDPKADLSSADRTAGREGDALEDPRKGGSRIQSYTSILITACDLPPVVVPSFKLGWG